MNFNLSSFQKINIPSGGTKDEIALRIARLPTNESSVLLSGIIFIKYISMYIKYIEHEPSSLDDDEYELDLKKKTCTQIRAILKQFGIKPGSKIYVINFN